MRILYATDGSQGALAAGEFLRRLPLHSDSRIRLLTAVGVGEDDEGADRLAAAREVLEPSRAALEARLGHGNPAEEILQAADEWPADLVVVGSHGLTGIARFFLGSVADRVARHARCPVLLARPLRNDLKTVVLGADRSEGAAYAAEWLREFPLPSTTGIEIVSVLLQYPVVAGMPGPQVPDMVVEFGDLQVRERAAVEERQASLASSFTAAGKEVTTRITSGDAALSLIQTAEQDSSDLIVVGAQGYSAIERFLLGSVSERVLRHAHCSVLVVKQPAGAHRARS